MFGEHGRWQAALLDQPFYTKAHIRRQLRHWGDRYVETMWNKAGYIYYQHFSLLSLRIDAAMDSTPDKMDTDSGGAKREKCMNCGR